MDHKSVTYSTSPLPDDLNSDEYKQILDHGLLLKLSNHSLAPPSAYNNLCLHLMHIIRCPFLGWRESNVGKIPLLGDIGQFAAFMALKSVDSIIQWLEECPINETRDTPFVGMLKRTDFLVLRSNILTTLGNHKDAVESLNKALKIDKNHLWSRFNRARLWGLFMMKKSKKIFDEFVIVRSQIREDHIWSVDVYAWITLCIMWDPTIANQDVAKLTYEKCLAAEIRHSVLYPNKEAYDCTPLIIDTVKETMEAFLQSGSVSMVGVQQRPRLDHFDQNSDKRKQWRYLCSNCCKNDCKLFACAKCKIVSYCSKECQITDWKKHKRACLFITDGIIQE
mmetsp:Transcript_1301/g.1589  ORF Transcript_1301/g.1589 Transcript_1301/m.1589 type:complete len:336 (-) Transcript_1301:538-1545(-)